MWTSSQSLKLIKYEGTEIDLDSDDSKQSTMNLDLSAEVENLSAVLAETNKHQQEEKIVILILKKKDFYLDLFKPSILLLDEKKVRANNKSVREQDQSGN